MGSQTEVRERPILFSGEMVRALLDGRKTQTRRVVKFPGGSDFADPRVYLGFTAGMHVFRASGAWGGQIACPYGQPGDRLHGQETWAVGQCADGFKPTELDPHTWLVDNGGLWYAADDAQPTHPISPRGKWRPGRFMPGKGGSWASRLTLELTEVRVQRVRDITEVDAKAEGATPDTSKFAGHTPYLSGFAYLWQTINGPRGYGWDANPWVWALTFVVRSQTPETTP